jgi:site-specific DNA-cytosine methylase
LVQGVEVHLFELLFFLDFNKIVVRILCRNYADDDILYPDTEEIRLWKEQERKRLAVN